MRREELVLLLAHGELGTHVARRRLELVEVWQGGELAELDLGQHHRVGGRDEPAQEVQRGGGVPVALQQPLGIPLPVGRLVAVDVLALEGHDLAVAFDHLGRLATRLAVLAGDAANAHVGPASNGLHDHAHLQHHAHLRLEPVAPAVHEALRAVAALHDEPLPARSRGQERLQPLGLVRLHQGRQRAELAEDLSRQLLVLILRHLHLRQRLP
mmetsp:Transcript_4722/g.6124  ORF Transcript_4722/g.6124 Transcript_4722/m.6124 type:complete len:212 (-) Transcript_4722:80-715(-)